MADRGVLRAAPALGAEGGVRSAGPLDPFAEARARISRFCWGVFSGRELRGWYGADPRGHTVGHLALEVEPGAWLLATGRCDLRHVTPWMRGVLPPALAQDLALLELVRQLDAWEAGSLATLSLARIEDAVAGLKEGLLSYPNLPNHREQTDYVLGVLRGWGVDVDDPFVLMDVEDGFRYDHESEDDYRDRMREREMRDDMERDLDIVPLRHTLRRNRRRGRPSSRSL